MSAPLLLVQLLASVCCVVVGWRAFCVVGGMNMHARGRTPYVHWLLFGLGYALLGLCAVGSLVSIWQEGLQIGYALWPVASAMLIVFDRRPRRARHVHHPETEASPCSENSQNSPGPLSGC